MSVKSIASAMSTKMFSKELKDVASKELKKNVTKGVSDKVVKGTKLSIGDRAEKLVFNKLMDKDLNVSDLKKYVKDVPSDTNVYDHVLDNVKKGNHIASRNKVKSMGGNLDKIPIKSEVLNEPINVDINKLSSGFENYNDKVTATLNSMRDERAAELGIDKNIDINKNRSFNKLTKNRADEVLNEKMKTIESLSPDDENYSKIIKNFTNDANKQAEVELNDFKKLSNRISNMDINELREDYDRQVDTYILKNEANLLKSQDMIRKGKLGVSAGVGLMGISSGAAVIDRRKQERNEKRARRGSLYSNAPGIR